MSSCKKGGARNPQTAVNQSTKQLHYGFRYHPDCCGHFTLKKHVQQHTIQHYFTKNIHICLKNENGGIQTVFSTRKNGAFAKELSLFIYLASSVDLCLEKPVPYQGRVGREREGETG